MVQDREKIELKNNLDKASSAYLTSAKHQPVHWQEWDDTVFDIARKKDLPVLLDIGAVWCHWCHVMDRESYENKEIADIINNHFVAIKVDRDERPDVDRRYQTFVQALGSGGGWPLTCFLTPEEKLFYGGTYFPPEERMGRPGLKNLLLNLSKTYHERKNEVFSSAASIFRQISEYEKNKARSGDLNMNIINKILADLENSFDPIHGGFGTAPKFPAGSAINFALLAHFFKKDEKFLDIAQISLDNIAAGGIYDHLGGGFHRYSVDQYWHVPHFEKMTSDNAEFMSNYLQLYHITGEEKYRRIVESIIGYFRRDMTDQKNGGFYAHQDADITLDDDGDYFTWTKQEIEKLLTPEELEVFNFYFGISEKPHDLHGTPDRNVLYRVRNLDKISEVLRISIEAADSLLESAKIKLLNVRSARQAPYIDKTIFANNNGMMLSAYAYAYKVLRHEHLKDFTVKTIDFILRKLYSPRYGFAHLFVNGKSRIHGLLSDQVWMSLALLDGFEISGDMRYFDFARETMDMVLEQYQDFENGGFFDRIPDKDASGIMAILHKPFEDVPVASANSIAIQVLDRLFALSDDERYRAAAEKTLKAFAGNLDFNGTHVSSFGQSFYYHIVAPPLVIIIKNNSDDQFSDLLSAAYSVYRPGMHVYVYESNRKSAEKLPAVIKSKISGTIRGVLPVAYVCSGTECASPTSDPGELVNLLKAIGK